MAAKKTTAASAPVSKTLTRAEYSLLLSDAITWRDEKVDADHVTEIRAAVKAGETPPIVVARWRGSDGLPVDKLVDGVHRTTAALENKGKTLEAILVEVEDENAAMSKAFELNNHKVLNLTVSERKKAMLKMLQLPCFKSQSNKALARLWKVSDMSIKRYRDMLKQESPNASQSGHKNKVSKTTATGPQTDAEPKAKREVKLATPDAATEHGLPISIQCDAQLCGGAKPLAAAITNKLTKGFDASDIEYSAALQVILGTIEELQDWAAAAEHAISQSEAEEKALDAKIAKAKK